MLNFFRTQTQNNGSSQRSAPSRPTATSGIEESELQGALAAIHKQLQADLIVLQSSAAGSHDSLRETLASVARQVDTIASSMEREHKLRLAMQFKHEKTCEELTMSLQEARETMTNDLQTELGDVLELLKTDAAGSLKDMTTIMVDVSKQANNLEQAVKKEREQRTAVEAKIDKMRTEQEGTILGLRRDMKLLVNDFASLKIELAEYGRDKAKIESAAGEANSALKTEFQQSHSILKDEFSSRVKCAEDNQNSMHNDLKLMINQHQDNSHRMFTDVTQQVQNMQQAARHAASTEICCAVEAKMDERFSAHEKMILDLRQDLQAAKESHAALKIELAEYSRSDDKDQAAIKEATLPNLLAGTHIELQEALRLLKSGGSNSLNGLVQQMGKLEHSVELLQRQMRIALGANLDKILSEQDKIVGALTKGLQVAGDESLSTDEAALPKKTILKHGSFALALPQPLARGLARSSPRKIVSTAEIGRMRAGTEPSVRCDAQGTWTPRGVATTPRSVTPSPMQLRRDTMSPVLSGTGASPQSHIMSLSRRTETSSLLGPAVLPQGVRTSLVNLNC